MHIQKRRQKYYLVHSLPKDVQSHFNKTKLIQSLRTADLAVAELRAAVIKPKWRAAIEEARSSAGRGEVGSARAFWEQQLADATSSAERAFLEAAIAGEATRGNVGYWRSQLAVAETEYDRKEVEVIIADEAEIRSQVEQLSDGQLEGQLTTSARNWFDQATGRSVPLREHLEDYRSSLQVAPKSVSMIIKEVSDFSSAHPLSSQVTRKALQEWIDSLKLGGSAPKTIRRKFSAVRGFWKWLQLTEIIPDDLDPFKRVLLPKDEVLKPRRAWKPEQVVGLHEAAKRDGDQLLADLIAIGAYTGMRREEICSLRADDCNEERFVIQKGKTRNAARVVPVHEDLRPVVRRLLKANDAEGYLMPGLPKTKYGVRSNAIGHAFSRLKTRLGFGAGQDFHSMRHTFNTMMEDAGVPEFHTAKLVGHSSKLGLTYGLYGHGAQLKTLIQAISKVRYPGLKP
ncbi:tyrosine-type recombinase/integrase [Thalassospira sp. CH_XMU1458]|uniref:tyrosine-type recombinase/integrase n=1 Tax=Thalassospira sp. CH_XMU1458 TaxID=3107776 RepID=UPI00300D11B5